MPIYTYEDFEAWMRYSYLGQEDSEFEAQDAEGNLVIDKLLSHLGIKVEQKRLEEEQLGMLNINNNLIRCLISF